MLADPDVAVEAQNEIYTARERGKMRLEPADEGGST